MKLSFKEASAILEANAKFLQNEHDKIIIIENIQKANTVLELKKMIKAFNMGAEAISLFTDCYTFSDLPDIFIVFVYEEPAICYKNNNGFIWASKLGNGSFTFDEILFPMTVLTFPKELMINNSVLKSDHKDSCDD